MKKFRFQLETLLRVTKRKKDDAELRFAEASRKLEEALQRQDELNNELKSVQLEYEQMTGVGKSINVGQIVMYNDYFNWKRMQIANQKQVVLMAQGDKQKRLKELMEVMSYLKSIEQLKEKRFREYKEELMYEEQKMLDEIGLQLYTRKN
ncbi:MAG: flagellar export protein FliJ [Selenomonadaceae bacterium]|nr:flagellar export protein FliJ [Selenomonadaceae bacterium]